MARRLGDNPYALADGGPGPVINLVGRLSIRARSRRYRWYLDTMRPKPEDRILDLGCGGAWSLAQLDPEAFVTGVDLVHREGFDRPNQRFVIADACELPFEDNSFDIGYSNSLIEHISPPRRPAFAREIQRVSHRHWVQTPNYWFPVEPHALLPGVQFLPDRVRRIAWRASPRNLNYEDSLRLLRRTELADLFNDAVILSERLGPLTKSFVAAGPRRELQADEPRIER